MIGGKRTVGCGKLRTAEVGKLFGMQLDGKTVLFCRLENPGHFLNGKGDAFAKTVNRIRQSLRIGFFQPRQNHVHNVVGVTALIFGRCRMRGQVAGDDSNGP
ncbi:N-formimino-L-glutamate deiminase [compost metagenome]